MQAGKQEEKGCPQSKIFILGFHLWWTSLKVCQDLGISKGREYFKQR
jgi:hypothetical protein